MGKANTRRVRYLSIAQARAMLGELAKHAHVNGEYFVVEKDGAPIIGIMDAEELEDYLELRDSKIQKKIQKSNEDIRAGRTRPAARLLEEVRKELSLKSRMVRRQKK